MGIYVVGMHRSGTSAVAGALSALCRLPAGRLAVGSNPAGQWERPELRPALELILAWNRTTWAQPPPETAPLGAPWPLRAYASRVFARHCRQPFLWKDPRLCLTIDQWLERPQDEAKVVFVHRHPEAVARSLRQRNGWPIERGLALWERTNRNAVTRLGGREVFAVDHDRVVAEPDRVIDGLGRWLACGHGDTRSRAVATVDRDEAAGRSASAPASTDSTRPDDDAGPTSAQAALAGRLAQASGPTRLDLNGVGPESTSTGHLLGSPDGAELGRQVLRALRAIPCRHQTEVAGSPVPGR